MRAILNIRRRPENKHKNTMPKSFELMYAVLYDKDDVSVLVSDIEF